MPESIKEFLRAYDYGSTDRIALYIPNKGHAEGGTEIDVVVEPWVNDAGGILSIYFEGATVLERLPGYFYNKKKKKGELTNELTDVIYSFGKKSEWEIAKEDIRRFLFRFGTQTGQELIIVEILGYYFKIPIENIQQFLVDNPSYELE